jgi:hypothetical protein
MRENLINACLYCLQHYRQLSINGLMYALQESDYLRAGTEITEDTVRTAMEDAIYECNAIWQDGIYSIPASSNWYVSDNAELPE